MWKILEHEAPDLSKLPNDYHKLTGQQKQYLRDLIKTIKHQKCGFCSDICFFTETSIKSESIEHFIEKGRYTDYSMNWDNLFLAEEDWNSGYKKSPKNTGLENWKKLLYEYILDPESHFEYVIRKGEKKGEILIVPKNENDLLAKELIDHILCLNSYMVGSNTLAKVRYEIYNRFKNCYEYSPSFPSMFRYFEG